MTSHVVRRGIGAAGARPHYGKIKRTFVRRSPRSSSGCLHIEFCTSRHRKSAISRVASAGATGRLSFLFNAKTDGGREVPRRRHRRFHAAISFHALGCDAVSNPLAAGGSSPNPFGMAGDDIDDFRIRIGRSRSRGARGNRLSQPFLKQVEAAVRAAGGNPKRIGGPAGKGSGRFNAHGRGAKLSFPRIAVGGGRVPPDGSERGGSSSRRVS